MSRRSRYPLVEILYFDRCPNYDGAVRTVERIASELGLDPDIRHVNVADPETAEKLRFLGSPTIRVRAGRRARLRDPVAVRACLPHLPDRAGNPGPAA